jgi:hypothetical protein
MRGFFFEMNYRQYVYSSIKVNGEIRLLHLQPGSEEEPLRSTIHHVAIDEAPPYSAISYVWGSPLASEVLLINEDYEVHITHSLSLVLRDIRALYCNNQEQVLWADGVCIDQSNLKERAQQVSIMKTIYRQASRVLTYTGPETGNSIQAVDFVEHLGEQIRVWEGERTDMSFPPANDVRWTALYEFFQRPWPSRLWIAQESLLSQSAPILLCGRRQICWYTVVELVLLAHDGYFPFVIRHSDTDPASSLLWLGELRASACKTAAQKNISLGQLLRACRAQKCTDARDKVFAILPLASDSELLQIKVEYSMSVQRLYTRVAANIIQQAKSLEILKAAGREKPSDLPSWVPDWTVNSAVVPLDWNEFFLSTESIYVYSAGGLNGCHAAVKADADSGVLCFQGAIIDRISFLMDIVCVKTKTKDHSWVAWLKDTRQVYDTGLYPTREAMRLALWLTLIGGRTHDRRKATDDYQPQYLA